MATTKKVLPWWGWLLIVANLLLLGLLFLSMENVIEAGGLDMKQTIFDVENALSLFSKNDYILPYVNTRENIRLISEVDTLHGYIVDQFVKTVSSLN